MTALCAHTELVHRSFSPGEQLVHGTPFFVQGQLRVQLAVGAQRQQSSGRALLAAARWLRPQGGGESVDFSLLKTVPPLRRTAERVDEPPASTMSGRPTVIERGE
jgi:hypothetical protein